MEQIFGRYQIIVSVKRLRIKMSPCWLPYWSPTSRIFGFEYNSPKSHYTKVRAYCSACDHLICKIFLRMFQKSSSFEEFNGLSEIDVHFFE